MESLPESVHSTSILVKPSEAVPSAELPLPEPVLPLS
jgi:hypothetical protein